MSEDFLELERALERDREARAAAEIEHVAEYRESTGELLDMRLERQRLGQQPRYPDERAREPLLIARKHAAGASQPVERYSSR